MKKDNVKNVITFQLFMVVLLMFLGTCKMNAQLKVGSNPFNIKSNTNLEVEASNGSSFYVSKDSGNLGINTFTPSRKIEIRDINVNSIREAIFVNKTGAPGSSNIGLTTNYGPMSNNFFIRAFTNDNIVRFSTSYDGTLYSERIGVGNPSPDNTSVLDIRSSDKGVLFPRVNLLHFKMQLGASPNANSLVVYNIGSTMPKGIYFWNGAEWKMVTATSASPAAIVSLDCNQAELSPSTFQIGVPYIGELSVPYTGGSGGVYGEGSTVVVNGLAFTLKEGKLNFGNGNLVFSVMGIPTINSPTLINLPINNATVPFYTGSCLARFGDVELAVIKTSSTIGPMLKTSDPSDGYIRYATSPDGKFSFALFIESGYAFGLTDIRIRSNVGTPTIMWNATISYVNGHIVNGNNALTIPAAGIWYGNGGGNGSIMGTGLGQSWGNDEIYYGSPEFRRYAFTTIDTNEKTFYEVTFFLGAVSSSLVANTSNCPGGKCPSTKAFIRVSQYSVQ